MSEPQGMGEVGARTAELGIGSVLGRGFSVIRGNLLPCSIIAVCFIFFQTVVTSLVFSEFMELMDVNNFNDPAPPRKMLEVSFGNFRWFSLLNLIFTAFLFNVLICGTVMHLRGQVAALGVWLIQGLRRLPHSIVVLVIMGIVFSIGSMLLIVPGVYFALVACMAVPAIVMERPGIFGSLRRSAYLTKGNRWRLLGLFLVLIILMIVVMLILNLMSMFAFVPMITQPLDVKSLFAEFRVFALFQTAVSAIFTMYGFIIVAVAYHDLQTAKEGDIGRVTAVFD